MADVADSRALQLALMPESKFAESGASPLVGNFADVVRHLVASFLQKWRTGDRVVPRHQQGG